MWLLKLCRWFVFSSNIVSSDLVDYLPVRPAGGGEGGRGGDLGHGHVAHPRLLSLGTQGSLGSSVVHRVVSLWWIGLIKLLGIQFDPFSFKTKQSQTINWVSCSGEWRFCGLTEQQETRNTKTSHHFNIESLQLISYSLFIREERVRAEEVIYAIFSIYWGRWTLQVLDVSVEKGVCLIYQFCQ